MFHAVFLHQVFYFIVVDTEHVHVKISEYYDNSYVGAVCHVDTFNMEVNITKTRLFKCTENFTTKKLKIFR